MTNKEADILFIKLTTHSSGQWKCFGSDDEILFKIKRLRYDHDTIWKIIRLADNNYQWAYNFIFKSLCHPGHPFNFDRDMFI